MAKTAFIEHITTQGERWDALAYRYYGDATQYERIILANPHVPYVPVLDSGVVLAVPVIDKTDTQTLEDVPPWLR